MKGTAWGSDNDVPGESPARQGVGNSEARALVHAIRGLNGPRGVGWSLVGGVPESVVWWAPSSSLSPAARC